MKKVSTKIGVSLLAFALLSGSVSAQMRGGGTGGRSGGMHQSVGKGRSGISQTELASLSIEDQRKLSVIAIELGLADKTTRTPRSTEVMSTEELAVHIQQRQALVQEREEKLHLFWLEAAKLNVGPYSTARKAQTLASIEFQQERLNQKRSRLNTLG